MSEALRVRNEKGQFIKGHDTPKEWTKIISDKLKGKRSLNWKGGRHINNYGYVMIWNPDNLVLGQKRYRRYQREHIMMAEKALGRKLKSNECVHHVNGIKHDNRNENFVVSTKSYHRWLENKMSNMYKKEHFGGI